MKAMTNSKTIAKRVKYLLNSVHISFELAQALKWRQLYKLLKKAQKLNSKFPMDKAELKQFAKDIANSRFEVSEETAITRTFDVEIQAETKEKNTFKFIPFVKPFISFFQDEYPLLLI